MISDYNKIKHKYRGGKNEWVYKILLKLMKMIMLPLL